MISLWLKFKMQKNVKNDSRITIELFYGKTARKNYHWNCDKYLKSDKNGNFAKAKVRQNGVLGAKI